MRGQVSAPIELIVAIIILVASSSLAFYVMNQTNEGKCIAQLKTQTQQLQQAMLDVALGSSGTKKSVHFSMPSCGSLKVVGMQFVYFSDAKYCRLCPGQYGGCWQLIPIAADSSTTYRQVTDAITCVDMPGESIFLTNGAPTCTSASQQGCCEQMSDTPCIDATDQCYKKYGGSSGVYGIDRISNNPSRWQTFGGDRNVNYNINITKRVGIGGGMEQTQLVICPKASN